MSNVDRPAENSGDASSEGEKGDVEKRDVEKRHVETGEPETRARTLLMIAAVSSAIGVAIAGTMSRTTGGVVIVASWVALVYALHAFGRAGSSR